MKKHCALCLIEREVRIIKEIIYYDKKGYPIEKEIHYICKTCNTIQKESQKSWQ